MKAETRQRIEAYKKQLPGMKSKVTGVAIMLVFAVVMSVTATFAWLTFSEKPEVKSIGTTVSANGNLEIALVEGKGETAPANSAIGDSSAVDNNVVRANLTWGNLVNLSDPTYGIQSIALRPARLNTDSLDNNPLFGALYGSDGRVESTDSDYTFAEWDGHEFIASGNKGVRAITKYVLAVSEASALRVNEMIQQGKASVQPKINVVSSYYKNNVMTTSNINGLKNLLTAYVSGAAKDKLNDTTGTAANTDISDYLGQLSSLYSEFYEAMTLQTEAYVELANFQLLLKALENDTTYNALTWNDLVANKTKYSVHNSAGNANTSQNGPVKLPRLIQFITEYNQAKIDQDDLNAKYQDNLENGTKYKYSDISTIVYRLAGTDKATVNGKTMSNIGTSDALGMLSNPEVQLTAGYLRDFEQWAVEPSSRISIYMNIPINGLSGLYAAVIGSGIKNAHLTTNATGNSDTQTSFNTESNKSVNLIPGDKIATDNYGLAIDLWVRTNSANNYLVLEGRTEAEETQVRVLGLDGSGNSVELYTASVTIEGVGASVDVYKKNGKYYENKTNREVTGINGTPTEKYETLTTVTGYTGENRIWDEERKPLLTEDNTTQGNGSCFIFYADTPEEQEKFLKLLSAFHIAFVSSDGRLLAQAEMDTEHALKQTGKITVPLAIKDLTYIEEEAEPEEGEGDELEPTVVRRPLLDEYGNEVYGIMKLEKNTPTMLTAIIYLDGDKLGNEDVLAASGIEGQLNFQFGTANENLPESDFELEKATRSVSATVDKTRLEYAGSIAERTATVTVHVEGDAPGNVSAFFQRAINSTQGKRMPTMTFAYNGTDWIGQYTFSAPGNYYLREVMLDGISYELPEPLRVTVSGYGVSGVNWGENEDNVELYLTERIYTEPVSLTISGAGSDTVTEASLRFVSNKGYSIDVPLRYNYMANNWEGEAKFTSSGVYTLQYAVINGEFTSLEQIDASYVKNLTLHMGLTAAINTTDSRSDRYEAGQTYSKNITLEILDDADTPITGLENVRLYYKRGNSTIDTVDSDMTWMGGSYTGTLPIVKAGVYSFLKVVIGDGKSLITRAATTPAAPVFRVNNPDPVVYARSSRSNYHDKVQFVPLTNDAYIGPFTIQNSETATISVVVKNSETNMTYEIEQSDDGLYYNGGWYINLPVYLDNNGKQTQDGLWTVERITLTDVYDSNGVEHTDANPLVWTNGVDGVDFSLLSTQVSSTINVSMNPGTTSLGTTSTAFMTEHKIGAESGMSVSIVDDYGRAIDNKIADVALLVNYTQNQDVSYGYKVANYSFSNQPIKLNRFGRNANDEFVWTNANRDDITAQYVGAYKVSKLVVTMTNGKTVELNVGENGVPEQYELRSAQPKAEDISVTYLAGGTEFGKTNGVVTGQFLQKYDLQIKVKASVQYLYAGEMKNAEYADISNMLTLGVEMNYQDGKTAPNGQYSWTGTSPYEYMDLGFSPEGNVNTFKSNSVTLLAGEYAFSGAVTWNANGVQGSKPLDGELPNIRAWSVVPEIRITGVNPDEDTEITVNANGDGEESELSENAATFKAHNRYSENYALVYMKYAVSEQPGKNGNDESDAHTPEFTDYTAPTVTFEGTDNSGKGMTLNIPGNGTENVTFSGSAMTQTVAIGKITAVTQSRQETIHNDGTCSSGDETVTFSYPTEHVTVLGTKEISTVTSTDSSITYTRTLRNPITLIQTNVDNPTLNITSGTGMTLTVKQGSAGISGGSKVPPLTELTVTATALEGYYNPRAARPDGALNWTVVNEGETTATYTFSMPPANLSVSGTATKYPEVRFSDANAMVTATAGSKTITSGTGIKPGTTITLAVAAKADEGYWQPRLSAPSGVTGWTATETGDYSASYSFTMPNATVTVAAPTTAQMYKILWTNTSALTFRATDSTESKSLTGGSYVIPGHQIRVTLEATGGTNPTLTSPAGAEELSGNTFMKDYSFAMPSADVTLAGTAQAYPAVVYGDESGNNRFATVALYNEGQPVDITGVGEKGVRPGNTVTVVLTVKEGYHDLTVTEPAGVTNWSANAATQTYSFKMPDSEVDFASGIAATGNQVTYNATGGTVSPASETYDGTPLTLPTPTLAGNQFNGWYTAASGGTRIAGSTYVPKIPSDEIFAQWTPYTVTYNYNGGSGSTSSATGVVTLPSGTRDHYTLEGWYTSQSGGTKAGAAGASYAPTSSLTLFARWTANSNTLTITNQNKSTAKVTVQSTGANVNSGSKVAYDTVLKIVVTHNGSNEKSIKITPSTVTRYSDAACTKSTTSSDAGTYYIRMPDAAVTITVNSTAGSSSCIASGTMITLADGSKKPVEDITLDDKLLIVNHDTGSYDVGTINFIESDGDGYYTIINLCFSNGVITKDIYEHGFFDLDLMKYVYIREDNYQDYVGHRFYVAEYDGENYESGEVILEDAYLSTEYTGCFSLVTDYHLNYFTDGVLSMPGGISGLFNIFEYGEDLKYDEEKMQADIETYGLFSYADFEELLPYEIYLKYPADYLSVALGKGLITWEYIGYLIERYVPEP